MSQALFAYPPQAEFNRVLPKNKIYQYAKPSRTVRELFVTQVSQIVWHYKLAPETVNLAARPGVPEIQIFDVALKNGDVSDEVLRCIDKAIPFPIIYNLHFNGRTKTVAAYKRSSEADPAKWIVDGYFESPWLPADSPRIALPVALDLAGLYEQMLRHLMPYPPRAGESLKAQVERLAQLRGKQHEYGKLENRLHREKQFNRKVALNAQLRSLKHEMESLTG